MICKTEINNRPGFYHLDEDVTYMEIFIPAGFIWDLASKPPWAKGFGFDKKDPRTEMASLIHDLLYYTHKFSRELCDDIYTKISIQNEYPKIKAFIEHRVIRLFGSSHWKNDNEDKELWHQCWKSWIYRPDVLELKERGIPWVLH